MWHNAPLASTTNKEIPACRAQFDELVDYVSRSNTSIWAVSYLGTHLEVKYEHNLLTANDEIAKLREKYTYLTVALPVAKNAGIHEQ